MKSKIIFFDSSENSKRGTLRGMIIMPIFILLTLMWLFFTKKSLYDEHMDDVHGSRSIVSLVVSGLLIVSALGVHNPDSITTAVTYAALVGLVTYGITNAVLLATLNKWDYTISVIDILWGIVSTAFLGYILYIVVNKFSDTLAPV